MRLLTMLATAVLLAACVHDTEDFNLFLTESGVSLTYYIGSDGDTNQKNHDDPWDTISEKFGMERVHTGKSVEGHDDPWDTIHDNFCLETVHTGKSGEEDPWNRIDELFPTESVHTGKAEEEDPWSKILQLFPLESVHSGKTDNRYFFGAEKSEVVFLSFSYRMPTTFRARVVEVWGRGLKLEFTDGVEQYVIDAPASWTAGTQLETGFVDATMTKDRPFLGVRFWRTVQGSGWGSRSESPAAELPVSWPKENQVSGASLLVSLPAGEKLHDDPWTQINNLFAKGGGVHDDPWNSIRTSFSDESFHVRKNESEHDDPWNTIRTNFSDESVHTGSGKAHDDPWDRIDENFVLDTLPVGGKKGSFGGHPISRMVFVSLSSDGAKADDPWERIHDNFSPEGGKSAALLKLMDVRRDIGRFELADGQSLYAVGVPTGWESGLVLRGEAYLLDTKKLLPLMGAMVWELDLNPLPNPYPTGEGL